VLGHADAAGALDGFANQVAGLVVVAGGVAGTIMILTPAGVAPACHDLPQA
jgi:hypothetical protein